MADRLVDLAANPTARRWVGKLGLPIPMPQKLARMKGPHVERPLADRVVIVGGTGDFTSRLGSFLPQLGASVAPVDVDPAPFEDGAAAWSRPLIEDDEDLRADAVVFDGTGLDSPASLDVLHSFFSPRIKRLYRCGRVVVLARRHRGLPAAHAAAQRAVEGFVRSVAKELGRRGSTANLIIVQEGAEERVDPVLRFLLTPASAYISGQVLHVSKTVRSFEDRRVRALDGKVALVTGAARGIGAETARVLAGEGATVVVLDRPDDDGPASKVAAEIGGSLFLGDVTDPQTGPRLRAHVEALGGLDILIHNAGVTRDKTLAKMRTELWDLAIDVNLEAVINLTEVLTPALNKRARIVCLSSIAGIAGNIGQTNYAASKAGVIGFVEAVAPVLARKGIALNAIAPGFIETRLTDAIPVATREAARRLCNLSQGGLPVDVAQAVTFLSTPGGAAMCGQTLRVCGGNFIGA